ncbi:MAG: threonylcarbamoyl-AMP synthase [Bdellovibrionales bacterium]|nr:threonylcarbamoyl-AMP synthase [Ramlibacter sp.]
MILDGREAHSIALAAAELGRGNLVSFPTETVYGLGADASSDAAVQKIFAAKGRPSNHPLIVHVAEAADALHFAASVPAFAQKLMDAFWPGPLTLILPRKAGIATASAGGQDSIGLRCPSHPVAQALLRACRALPGQPVTGLAAPSANQFGRVSPTTASHVQGEFGSSLMVLDGGACEVGIESTIVDCTRGAPVLLRPGLIERGQIEAACGSALVLPGAAAGVAPRASGTLEAHYAPNAKLRLMDAAALQTALNLLGPDAANIAIYSRVILMTPAAGVIRRRMPDDAAATAQQLFAVLRDFDAKGVRLIWVETPPDTPAWEGVRDRLQRASAA